MATLLSNLPRRIFPYQRPEATKQRQVRASHYRHQRVAPTVPNLDHHRVSVSLGVVFPPVKGMRYAEQNVWC